MIFNRIMCVGSIVAYALVYSLAFSHMEMGLEKIVVAVGVGVGFFCVVMTASIAWRA